MKDWRSYDGVAATYERVLAPRFAEVARDLLDLAEVKEAARVLDVGTGTGVAGEAARDAGAWCVGVDPSLDMLGEAHRVRPGVTLAAAGAIDLPFADRSFDLVVGNFVLAHFTKAETALFDMLRVLRPGGRIAFSAWADNRDTFTDTWRELVESVVPRDLVEPTYDRAVPGHDRFMKREELEQLFIDAGLRHVRTEPRRYRWTFTVNDWIDGQAIYATGRFVHQMLGDTAWDAFIERAKATFRSRFSDPLNDFHDIWLAVGTKL